jgi:hypothetical protein
MDLLDAEVLATFSDDILGPAVIEQAIAFALEELSPQRQDRVYDGLERELVLVRAECDRLAEAIGRGGPLDALLERLRERQARRTALEQQLADRRVIVVRRPALTLSSGSGQSWHTGAGY